MDEQTSESSGSSKRRSLSEEESYDETTEQQEEDREQSNGLEDGMDPEGFSGEKVVKPLTPEALAVFQAAQERAGVVYISRIPPGMRPTKVRHLMSQYGEIGKVYLQQEGKMAFLCYVFFVDYHSFQMRKELI
jgi:ESF2/ABP1 family protein